MLFTQPESCTRHRCRGIQHLPLHKHLIGGILLPSCSSFLVLCGVLPSPIASAPGSPAPQADLNLPWTRPVSPWKEAPGTPYNPTPAGAPCSLGAAFGLVLGDMLSCWLQHGLQQYFCAPLVSPVMEMLCSRPAAPLTSGSLLFSGTAEQM